MTSASHSFKRYQFSLILWAILQLLLSVTIVEATSTVKKTVTPLPTENPSAPLFGQDDASLLGQPPDGFQRLLLTERLDGAAAPAPLNAPQNPACSTTSNAANLAFGFSFRTDGNNGGLVQRIGNTIDVRERFVCSLTGSWYYFGAVEGDIDGEFSVWIGSGGIPTSMVASQIINSTALAADSWNFIDWASFGLTFTDDFYLAFGTVLGSGGGMAPDDRIQAMSDGGTGPPRIGVTLSPSSGGWFKNEDFWSQDINFAIDAIVCCEEIPFTNCELQTDADSYSSVFSLPSSQNCRKGVGMRFETGGFDTLVQAEISLTDLFSGLDPNGEVTLELLADNGSGIPDPNDPLAPPLVVGGPGLGADLYPLGTFGFITYPLGQVALPPATTYHITVRWTGNDLAAGGLGTGIGSDNYQAGEGNLSRLASVYFPGTPEDPITNCVPTDSPGWSNYFSVFGIVPDFLISVFTCRDEFIDCELAKSYNNASFTATFDETEEFTGFAAAFPASGEECRIDEAAVGLLSWEGLDGVTLSIYSDNNGFPGAVVVSEFIDTLAFPFPSVSNGGAGFGFFEIFPNSGTGVDVIGQYHLVLRPAFRDSIDPNRFIQIPLSDGGETVASAFELNGTWVSSDQIFVDGNNVVARTHRCCNPFGRCRCVCTPGDDWPTYQKNQSRSGVSSISLGDANCNLSLLWSASSDKGNSFSGSVITNGIVYVSDDGGFDARDALSGALLWDQDTDPTVGALFSGATDVRTQPTIAVIDTGGLKVTMAFLGTGLNRDVVAVNAFTGEYLWHNTSNSPFPGLHPKTSNIKSVVINDGTNDVLIYAAQTKVYAVLAASGAPYPGWNVNPVVLSADNVNAISSTVPDVGGLGGPTDLIFVPTFNGAIPGDIYAIDFLTGALVWSLASIIGNTGLEAGKTGAPGYQNNEGFFSGAAYDHIQGVVWANSSFDADFPAEGFLYRIAVDGSSYHAEPSVSSRRATPLVDENLVYVPAFSKWENPWYDGTGAFERVTGEFFGAIQGRFPLDRQFNDGVLTCEAGQDRWLISGTERGQLQFSRVGFQNELIFYRETTNSGSGSGAWAGGSLADDLLVFTTLGGTTVALGSKPDRPRLDILNVERRAHVPFGTPPATPVAFENVFSNSGCADLVIDSIRLNDIPNFPTATGGVISVSTVSPALAHRMNEVASYTTNASIFHKIGLMRGEAPDGLDPFSSLNFAGTESELNYRAATGFPDVVTSGAGPDGSGVLSPAPGAQIAPGDSVALVIAIEGPAVTRGAHTFYATLWTSDPDYFLDDPAAAPEVALTVVGGCLEDSVRIHFGAGGANSTTVYNDGLIGRVPSGANDIDINGYTEGARLCGSDLTELFAGLRGFSLTPRRIAMTGPSWDGDDYHTILGDLNYCSNTCQPQLQTNVLLGAISHDSGLTYDPVLGNLAATTYIDSAQDYSAGTGVWDTRVFPDILLNDSTIGIIVNETHYGALDVPELADFRLIRIDVTNRSATDSIVDLYHLAIHDDDIGALIFNSVQGRPKKFGYAYAATPQIGIAHGYIKVPSGCGFGDDIMRAAALDQSMALWNFEEARFYDSIYQYARLPQFDSIHFQTDMNTFEGDIPQQGPTDAASLYSFGRIDLAPSETKSFAIAQFVKVDCANLNPDDDNQFIGLADLVNKWAGFHRGDVNNDLQIDLLDIVYLANIVAGSSHGAFPFAYLSDVNNDAATDMADLSYLVDFYFNCGPCPIGDWTIALCNQ